MRRGVNEHVGILLTQPELDSLGFCVFFSSTSAAQEGIVGAVLSDPDRAGGGRRECFWYVGNTIYLLDKYVLDRLN